MALIRPQMLKDFLADDSNSCSSTDFRSFPRKNPLDPNTSTTKRSSSIKLTRNRSSKAASTTISAIHRASEMLLTAVKHFPFASSAKSQPRTTVSRRRSDVGENDGVPVVKVKDILRWRSFRDLVVVEEEEAQPLDLCSSRWCDEDFTAEDLPLCGGNCGQNLEGEKCLPEESVGGDSTVDPKGELSCEEKEQCSPVSVLNFPFQEDEESISSFHQSLANLNRRKHTLMQNIQDFEGLAKLEPTILEGQFSLNEKYSSCEEEYGDHDHEYVKQDDGIEEKARQLLDHVKASSLVETCETDVDQLLLDFFRNELATRRDKNDDEFDCEMLRVAKDWMCEQYDESFEWEVEGKREAYVRDMEGGVKWRWSKFEEEQQELAMETEVGVLNCLLDELLVDLSCSLKRKLMGS
ncbi:unnamed protein product [Camellia sinensis]